MGNVYALLVGIDQYDERLNIPELKGCANDIQRIQVYLKSRVSKETDVHVRALTNEQATRQGVIDGFRQHLSQAKSGDTALFYYAGYGARCIAPQNSVETRIESLTETLVCYDSRVNNAPNDAPQKAHENTYWDLAAPELTQLFAEISQTQAHVVAILDARQMEPDLRSRPRSSFIASQQHVGRYVLMKASNLTEQAQEYFSSTQPNGTQPSGAFSHFLYKALSAAHSSPTYQNLFQQTNALIRSSVPTQSPQLIATHPEDLNLPFLGDVSTTAPRTFIVRHNATKGWIMNGGAVHGLPASTGNETTGLALFPQGSTPQQMANIDNAIATARIQRVHPRFCAVQSAHLTGKNKKEVFKAVITNLSIPSFQVHIDGDDGTVSLLQRAIAAAGPNGEPSLYVQPTDLPEKASFHVLAQDGTYTLTTTNISASTPNVSELNLASLKKVRPLMEPLLDGYDTASAARMASALEHIARWKTIVELASPANTPIQGAVDLKLYSGDETDKDDATLITADQIRLIYKEGSANRPQAQTPPRFRIKLHNTSKQPLYCGLFYLTERFKAAAVKPDKVNSIVQLAPGEEMWFAGGLPLYGTVPDDLWQQGITECQDMMKLVACTQPFDPTLMNLGPLGTPIGKPSSAATPENESGAHNLNQLMQRIIHRELPAQASEGTASWMTSQIAFTFVRPSLPVALNPSTPTSIGASAASAPNVIVQTHPQFTSTAQLTTPTQAAHTFGLAALTPLLQTEPFSFSASRNSASGLSVLQLTHLQNVETVTAEQPIRIATDILLAEDEYILPVAYDGEVYLPLGYGKTDQGKTQIFIERLPASSHPEQSHQKGVCITFQKVKATRLADRLSQRYGKPVAYPLLSAANVEPSGAVNYTQNTEAIAFKAKQAKKIALYLPGPFNDTEADLPHLNQALIAADQAADHPYDLLLTFDYDGFDTTVEQNAEALAQYLTQIGLTANHDKQLHVIAHTTSGLIARWFIEQAGGNDVVNHLFMLGTPNAGMTAAQVQSGTTAAIALTLNGLSHLPTPINTIGNLFRFNAMCAGTSRSTHEQDIQQNTTIQQTQPQSPCLQTLLNADDPDIPYTIITGQRSSTLALAEQATSLHRTILNKLLSLDATVFHAPANDLIVSANSMAAFPNTWHTQPEKLPVDCRHLEYLTHPQSISTLAQALTEALTKALTKVKKQAKKAAPLETPPLAATPLAAPQQVQTQPPKPLAKATRAAIVSTSAGIAAASTTIVKTPQTFSQTSATEGSSSMQEPPQPPEPKPQAQAPEPKTPETPEPQASEPQTPEPQTPEPQTPEPQTPEPQTPEPQTPEPKTPEPQAPEPQTPETHALKSQTPVPQIPETQTPERQEPSEQLPVAPLPQNNEPAEVYAPNYEASPEAKSSPLMWVWVLFTAVLAGLVALGWIQYFNSPITPSGRDSSDTSPDSSEPELPAIPDTTTPTEAPIAPESET